MNDCGKFENGIQSLIAGDPELEQLEELVGHSKTCRDCRELFDMNRTLLRLGRKFDELESADLSEVRAAIIKKVSAKRKRHFFPEWIAVLRTPLQLRPLTAIALLAVVFAIGLAASRLGDHPTSPAINMADAALSDDNLMDLENSPYTFSNIAVRSIDNSTVSLSFDITKHVEIVDSTQSELVKGVLMHSLVNPSPTGAVGYFERAPLKRPLF